MFTPWNSTIVCKIEPKFESPLEDPKQTNNPIPIKTENTWDDTIESNVYESETTSIKPEPKPHQESSDWDPCDICGLKSVNRTAQRKHAKRHLDDYICEICHKRVGSKSKETHQKWHERVSVSAGSRDCHICNRTFVSARKLAMHQVNFHGILDGAWARKDFSEWPHRCDKCGFHFRYLELVKYHTCSEIEEPSYDCKICKEKFDQIELLTLHISEEHNIALENQDYMRYKCEKCEASFKFNGTFRNHLRKCLDSPSKQSNRTTEVQCKSCDKKFNRRYNLVRHMETVHTDQKKFACTRCKNTYAEQRALEDHFAKEHLGKPRYECEFCKKSFYHASDYSKHRKRKHPDEYAKLVEQCPTSSVPLNELYSMSGCVVRAECSTAKEKVHCPICNRKLSNSDNLERHMKIHHLQEKRYACISCDKKFKEKNSLEDHFALKHLGKPRYQCEFCDELFYWKSLYGNHRRLVHQEQYTKLIREQKTLPYNQLYMMNGCEVINQEQSVKVE